MGAVIDLSGFELWIFPLFVLGFTLFFGVFPGLILRAVVQLYPRGHPRREELFGELYHSGMGRIERFEFVFQQFETALREGLTFRRSARVEQDARRNMPGHAIGGTLKDNERLIIQFMDPKDRARHLLWKRIKEADEMAVLLPRLPTLLCQTAISVIRNIR